RSSIASLLSSSWPSSWVSPHGRINASRLAAGWVLDSGSGRQPLHRRAAPGDLSREALLEVDARLPAEMAEQFAGVGPGDALIAEPRGFAPDQGAEAKQALQAGKDLPHVGGLAAADVVHLAHRRFEA